MGCHQTAETIAHFHQCLKGQVNAFLADKWCSADQWRRQARNRRKAETRRNRGR